MHYIEKIRFRRVSKSEKKGDLFRFSFLPFNRAIDGRSVDVSGEIRAKNKLSAARKLYREWKSMSVDPSNNLYQIPWMGIHGISDEEIGA